MWFLTLLLFYIGSYFYRYHCFFLHHVSIMNGLSGCTVFCPIFLYASTRKDVLFICAFLIFSNYLFIGWILLTIRLLRTYIKVFKSYNTWIFASLASSIKYFLFFRDLTFYNRRSLWMSKCNCDSFTLFLIINGFLH